jgi:hypothetical protein
MKKKNDLYNRTDKYNSNGNQTGYKKWNDLYKRYDVYDANGNKVGHYKYNDLYQKMGIHRKFILNGINKSR